MQLKNKPYIVTKASDDGTFQVGDHIKLLDDGAVVCREAGGWVDVEDVAAATAGMAIEFDMESIKNCRTLLLLKLKELEEIMTK